MYDTNTYLLTYRYVFTLLNNEDQRRRRRETTIKTNDNDNALELTNLITADKN